MKELKNLKKLTDDLRPMSFWAYEVLDTFYLTEFNRDMDKAWNHIKKIYNYVLYDDPNWHYFYEGSFAIIRCSRTRSRQLKKYLRRNKILFKHIHGWVGENETVSWYWPMFMKLFHNYSLMALVCDKRDLVLIFDRVTHCFMNNCEYIADNWRGKLGVRWEAYLQATTAMDRAFNAGKVDLLKGSKSETSALKKALVALEKNDRQCWPTARNIHKKIAQKAETSAQN